MSAAALSTAADPNARHIPVVTEITPEIEAMAAAQTAALAVQHQGGGADPPKQGLGGDGDLFRHEVRVGEVALLDRMLAQGLRTSRLERAKRARQLSVQFIAPFSGVVLGAKAVLWPALGNCPFTVFNPSGHLP